METDASRAEAETGSSYFHRDVLRCPEALSPKAETADEAADAVGVLTDAHPQREHATAAAQQTDASTSSSLSHLKSQSAARSSQVTGPGTFGLDPGAQPQSNERATAPSPDPDPIPTPSPNRGRQSTRQTQQPSTSCQIRDGPTETLGRSGTRASAYPPPSPAGLAAAASAAALAAALGSARLAAIAAARGKPLTLPRTPQPAVHGGSRGGRYDAPPSPTASVAASVIVGGRRGGRGGRGDAPQPPSVPAVVRGGRGGRREGPASPTGSVAASVIVGGRRGGRGGRRGAQLSPTSSVISMPMTPTHVRGGRPPRSAPPAPAGAPAEQRRGGAGGGRRRATAFADPAVAAAAVAAGSSGGGGSPAGNAAASATAASAAVAPGRSSSEQELLVSHSKVVVDRELLAVEVRRLASQVQHLTEQQGLLQGELQRLLNQNSSLNSALASTVTTCESQAELMDILSEAVRNTVLVDEHDVVAAKAGMGTVTIRLQAEEVHDLMADGHQRMEVEDMSLMTIAE